ncbi:MAG: DUF6478 family protein [Pseudomonadota bacterium]
MTWLPPKRLGDPLPDQDAVPSDCDLYLAPVPLRQTLSEHSADTGTNLGEMFALHYDSSAAPQLAAGTTLEITTPGFDGTYLSLTLTLTKEAARSLSRHHLIHLQATVAQSTEQPIFARLSAESGPNTDVITEELATDGESVGHIWDMYHTQFDAMRPGSVWMDLIFSPPAGGRIHVTDLHVFRTPRGGF